MHTVGTSNKGACWHDFYTSWHQQQFLTKKWVSYWFEEIMTFDEFI
jgi:hypothetical protein